MKGNGGGFFLPFVLDTGKEKPLTLSLLPLKASAHCTLNHKESRPVRSRGPVVCENEQSQMLPPSVDKIKIEISTPNFFFSVNTQKGVNLLWVKGDTLRKRKLYV